MFHIVMLFLFFVSCLLLCINFGLKKMILYVTHHIKMSRKSHMVKCRKMLPKVLNLQNIDFENFTFLEYVSCDASIKY